MTRHSENDNKVEPLSLVDSFKKYFTIELVNSLTMKQKVYHIRYRVYCEEFEYETADSCPDEMEKDEYDEYSLHCLITHKSTNTPAACVRMVPATVQGHDETLPFEKYCSDSIDWGFINKLNLDHKTECEISRLAVDKIFRKRSGESSSRFGAIDNFEFSKEERRTFLMIAVAAFLAATALTELSGKTNVFAMMEPFLPRLLKRSGIIFHRAGKDIDYHGIRAPYFITTQSALDNMRPELLELYQWIHQQIEQSYNNR